MTCRFCGFFGRLRLSLNDSTFSHQRRDMLRKNGAPQEELEGAEPDTAAGPEDEAESRERRQELLRAIDALENTDREILLRKYFMSQNSKDIARIMHMTVSAVDTRAHRAVKKLRSILGGDKYE